MNKYTFAPKSPVQSVKSRVFRYFAPKNTVDQQQSRMEVEANKLHRKTTRFYLLVIMISNMVIMFTLFAILALSVCTSETAQASATEGICKDRRGVIPTQDHDL